MTEALAYPFGPDDDNFHHLSDDEWETETCWFSFNVPERKMGGWFYGFIRPNKKTVTTRFFVWDDTSHDRSTLAYYFAAEDQPLPHKRDLRDFTFPPSYRVKVLKPLMEYELAFKDPDGKLTIEARFSGVHRPHPFKKGQAPFRDTPHLDQAGHLSGEMTLKGERIPIDCYSVRDRSWGPRRNRPARTEGKGERPGQQRDLVRGDWRAVERQPGRGRIQYIFGTTSERVGFLGFMRIPRTDPESGWSPINSGYLFQDGESSDIAMGRVQNFRDPRTGFSSNILVEAEDTSGRKLHAEGHAVSRIAQHGAGATSLFRWLINGKIGWGEDQDIWHPEHFDAMVRELRATR